MGEDHRIALAVIARDLFALRCGWLAALHRIYNPMARYRMKQKEASSAIAGASYNDRTNELAVTFTSGRKVSYTYSGVPDKVAENFFNAGSKGSYFNRVIRNNYSAS